MYSGRAYAGLTWKTLYYQGLPHSYSENCEYVVLTLLFYSLAGRAVSEEKQKDAGHFDPFCHNHSPYYYFIWDKVLIFPLV